ncbi:MAG: PEGA domain-containing protein [Deltaproteobacteria bacterium]|nr:PEGA domain-containing protein [Deltaproteobacteria bacterium]
MAKGWADIVDPDDFSEDEKTVQAVSPFADAVDGSEHDGSKRDGSERGESERGAFGVAPSRVPTRAPPPRSDSEIERDPVLAAIAELDGPAAARRSSASIRSSKDRPRSEAQQPTERQEAGWAAASKSSDGERGGRIRKLSLPRPGERGPSLQEAAGLSAPVLSPRISIGMSESAPPTLDGSEPGRRQSTPREPAFSQSFSPEEWAEQLGEAPAPPKPKRAPWREYREVITVAFLGLCAIGGAIAYQETAPNQEARAHEAAASSTATQTPEANVASASMTAAPDSKPSPPPATNNPRTSPLTIKSSGAASASAKPSPSEPAPELEARSEVKPMLSVITIPAGASVEINGVPLGRSPLVRPSPHAKGRIEVTVKKQGFNTTSSFVSPNSAGHYSLTVQLEKSAGRRR